MSGFRIFAGVFIMLFGVSFFVDLPVFKMAFALFIILIGLRVLLGHKSGFNFGPEGETNEDKLNRVLIFSAMKRKFVSANFQGGDFVTIFAGGEIDLTEAKSKEKKIELNLVAIFGGLKLRIPPTWSVKSEGVGIAGGFDNNAKSKEKSTTQLVINGVAILGGVEVTN